MTAPAGHDAAARAGISRRALIRRGAVLAAALTALPAVLAERGLVPPAAAASDPLTFETFEALVAFVLPGDDPFSLAQGEHHPGPGAVAGGTSRVAIATLDAIQPGVPVSATVAALLNEGALAIAPTASRGGFAAPFARLSFGEKAQVFARLESDPRIRGTALENAAHLLPGLVATLALGEAGVFDRETRTLTGQPVGWQITGYTGPSDGEPELVGYWRRHRRARTSRRYARRRRAGARRRRSGR